VRNAFKEEVTELGREDERVVLLMGDIGNRMFDAYQELQSERFFNCGVAEANMVSVAAGLASTGLRPVCYTITPFMTARCYEQIRIDVCYHDQPVVIVGTGAGLSYASLGATHHSWDDIALMRVLPGMRVFCPGDAMEVKACLRLALKQDRPAYIRIGKKGEPVIHEAVPDLELGRFFQISQGERVGILSCGNVLPMCVETRELLKKKEGIDAELMSCFNVKPLDTGYLDSAFDRFDVVVTIEEHSRIGGFGSAVAEWLADREPAPNPARLLRFGIDDAFFHNAGEQDYMREQTGLEAISMAEAIASKLP